LAGVGEQAAGVQLLDWDASTAVSNQVHDVSPGIPKSFLGTERAQRPVQLCHIPSSNTARLAARNKPLAVNMTPVGLTTCPSGIGVNFAPFSTCAEYTRHSALISVCIASTDSALSLLANCRSIPRARRIASFESSFGGTSLGFAGATFAAAFGLPLAAERRDLAAALGDDIKLVSLFHQLVFPQLQLPVGDAFAGLHVVFHAVPGADEVHLGVREIEPLRCLVGTQPLLDLGDGETLAGRAALMQAEIAVGVELAFMPEYADLVLTGE